MRFSRISISRRCRRRCGCRCTNWRSASRTGSRARSERGTSAIWRHDFFGFDSGAQIGLELRYGLARGTQIGVHRTSDRTTQIFGQHSFWTERDGKPFGLDGHGDARRREQPARALPERAGRTWCRGKSAATPRCTPSRSSSSTRNPFADAGCRQQHADGRIRRRGFAYGLRPTSSRKSRRGSRGSIRARIR